MAEMAKLKEDILEKLRAETHNWREKLEKIYIEEHAPWAESWAECLAFLCQCPKCKAFLAQKEVDVKMITEILRKNAV